MTSFLRPSKVTRITRTFAGHKAAGSFNPGVDYGAVTGTDVLAPDSGTVTIGKSTAVGTWVHIDHDGKGQWGWSSDLLHLSKVLVKNGAWVARGEHIAESGATGTAATGPHIHWSLRKTHGAALLNSQNVDPELYIAKAVVKEITRKTGASVVNTRALPTTDKGKAPVMAVAKAKTTYVVVAWAKGETVDGNNTWFKLKSGQWAWSGAFTSISTVGLTELKNVLTPPIVVPPVPTELEKVKAALAATTKELTKAQGELVTVRAILAAVKKAVS